MHNTHLLIPVVVEVLVVDVVVVAKFSFQFQIVYFKSILNLLVVVVGRRITNETTEIPTVPAIPAAAIKPNTIFNQGWWVLLKDDVFPGILDEISPLILLIGVTLELFDVMKISVSVLGMMLTQFSTEKYYEDRWIFLYLYRNRMIIIM